MLTIDTTILTLVDVQERLAVAMDNKETLITNLEKLIKGVQLLGIPVIWLEQYPRGLGQTIEPLQTLLADQKPIEKLSFSCCGDEAYCDALKASGRTQVLLAGIETHVCVYQTARDLLSAGFKVQLLADAVTSRTLENKRVAIERMAAGGITISSVEMTLFELLETSEHPSFRDISRLIK